MEFDLSPEQRKRGTEIRESARELDRLRAGRNPGAHFERADWSAVARAGLTGSCLPVEYGGGGLGALDTALSLEAFGEGCTELGLPFAVAAHLLACAVPIRDFADPRIRGDLLAGLAAGSVIAANAMTEDEAGSDIVSLTTTAVPDGNGYVLTGEKSFVSNGPLADVFVAYAVTDPAAGFLGLSGFVVPRDLPGVEVGPPMEKMGLHGCPASRVRFDGCRIPAGHCLGEPGQGTAVFHHSMLWERACLFAIYLGQMQRQLDRCVQRTRDRRQFNQKIGSFQAVSHRIAAMAQRLAGARLLLYRACWAIDQGRADVAATAMAKVAVSEAAVANSLDAIQLFGGAGYLVPTGIEQQLRDSVPSTIFSGTTEIQRELIATEVML
ncbi:acyl-CoA dehydrogenase family protein [Actinoplanes sp. NPDC004185]